MNNLKRTILTSCLLLLVAAGALAQHWTVDARAFQYDMTAYAQLKVCGVTVSDYADYEVAAFCQDECRGVAKALAVEGGSPLLYLRIRSNVIGDEVITFRVYQASTDTEFQLEETIAFESESVASTPGEPLVLVLGDVLKGDVNGDGKVLIGDVITILNYIVGSTDNCNEKAADVNGDGKILIGDVIGVLNIIVQK